MKTYENQLVELGRILKKSEVVSEILQKASLLRMPNWYLASGSIAQTVWNSLHGVDLNFGIKDYDLIYFDPTDLSVESENVYIHKSQEVFKDLAPLIEIKNEARVHLWFEKCFGFAIPPYKSAEDAISSWSTTASCIGVRCDNGGLEVCAPYGLDDLFQLIVRPTKCLFTREMYEEKANKWKSKWPRLQVIPWE